jgi:hypothetical protein
MSTPDEVEIDSLLLVVVGANLRAELSDRAQAYRLCERIDAWQDEVCPREEIARLRPVVCTDVWYLNNGELMERPTIAVGNPTVNAASAYLSTRLPTAFVIEDTLRVHLDPDFIDMQVCMWGADDTATTSAVDLFISRHMDAFLREAAGSKT